jgi:acylphosphatase
MDAPGNSSTTETPETMRLHATVEGRVQGVGFRYFVQENAVILGISGWVRNRWDGAVEVLAEGNQKKLEKFYQILQRGPRAAFVSEVSAEWLPATGEFHDFRVRMTE